jgi:hypothetical protein
MQNGYKGGYAILIRKMSACDADKSRLSVDWPTVKRIAVNPLIQLRILTIALQ